MPLKSLVAAAWQRPAVAAAAAFAAGTRAGLHGGSPAPAAAAAAAAAGLALVASGRSGPGVRLACRLAAVLLAGWALAAEARVRRERVLADAAGSGRARVIRLSGTVATGIEHDRARNGAHRCRFALAGVRLEDGRRIGPVRVSVVWYGPAVAAAGTPEAGPRVGERWSLRGQARVEGKDLSRARLQVTSSVEDSERLALAGRFSWRAACDAWRCESARRLALGVDGYPRMLALSQAILLGCRGEIPRDLNRVFRDSGTVHVFAISGAHVVILGWLLAWPLARAGVPRPWWAIFLVPTLLLYTLATGAQPSALRACLMAALYLAAPLLNRRPDGLTILAVSALALLAADPFQLADVGFVLSYTVVAGLIVLTPPLLRRFRRAALPQRLLDDARATTEMGGEMAHGWTSWRRRTTARLWRATVDLTAVSVAAWLASAPLTAYYFGRVTPASLLANLAVVPLSSAMVAGGCLSLVAGSVAEAAAAAVNAATLACAWLMCMAARASVALPGSVGRVPHPGPALLAAWYLALAFWAWRMAGRDRARGGADWLTEETPR
jgi:ComEC/Rec2-related protein